MDSITQIALGAAVGEATAGRQLGRKAQLYGAVLGTLPDLDVLAPLGDAVKDFTYHRSWSHSFFVLALLTPLIVWLIRRLHPDLKQHFWRWAVMVYAIFSTHILLDSFTTYGTQIFWPFVTTPVSWSTIFIIDPLYTIPLLAGVIAALILRRNPERGFWLNWLGLMLSTLYLGWTVLAKQLVEDRVYKSLTAQQLEYQSVFTTPAPFNSVLWRTVVMTDQGYYEGYYSVLDGDRPVSFSYYPSDTDALTGIEDLWVVQRLKWFSYGFYSVQKLGSDIVMRDLRMGVEPNYVFSFKVAEEANPHPRLTEPVLLPVSWDNAMLGKVWRRITDPSIQLSP